MIDKNYLLTTENDKYKELVAIPKRDLKNVKELYQDIFKIYSGKLTVVRAKLAQHKTELNYKDQIIQLLKEKRNTNVTIKNILWIRLVYIYTNRIIIELMRRYITLN